jgi:hypothetical protein
MRHELIQKYSAALISHSLYVYAASQFFLDCAHAKPKLEYYQQKHFEEYVAERQDSLPELTPLIDQDITQYWKASLAAVKLEHLELLSHYRKEMPQRRTSKPKRHLKISLAHMDIITDDIDRCFKRLTRLRFMKLEDVANWKDLAMTCGATIERAFMAHEAVFQQLDSKTRSKIDGLRSAGKFLGGAAPIAISIAKMLMGVPPS